MVVMTSAFRLAGPIIASLLLVSCGGSSQDDSSTTTAVNAEAVVTTTSVEKTDGVDAAIAYLTIEEQWNAYVTAADGDASVAPSANDQRLNDWFVNAELTRRQRLIEDSLVPPFTRFAGNRQLGTPTVNAVYRNDSVEIINCVRNGLTPYDPLNDVIDSVAIPLEFHKIQMVRTNETWQIESVAVAIDSARCKTEVVDGQTVPAYAS